MRVPRFVSPLIAVIAAGCGGATVNNNVVAPVSLTAGGQVLYASAPNQALSGVTVSLTAPGGASNTVTTDSSGLWSIAGLSPGIYAASYTKAGYETVKTDATLAAFGQNNVANPFVPVPASGQTQLQEALLSGTVSPFGVSVKDGTTLTNGIAGATLVYSVSGDGAITFTFPRVLYTGFLGGGGGCGCGGRNCASLTDSVTGANINALVNATAGTFTFSKAQIDAMNGGGPGSAISVTPAFTVDPICVEADYLTPINGTPVTYRAIANFSVTQ